MRWRKLGKVFDFATSGFQQEFSGFAQSPQALVLADRVRFYFSTRPASTDGKYVSVVQYVDMDRDLTSVLGRSHSTVVPLGALGTFDEHGIFPFSVFEHGNEMWGYSNGWNRRASVSVDTAIGLAISTDGGETFQKIGAGPVLGPSLHEPFLVCDPFVRVFDGVFHMWYIHGIRWSRRHPGDAPERTYVIAHATSDDGVEWVREGRPIIPQLDPEECQALPTVIKIGSRFHMMFCHRGTFDFRDDPAKAYRLGYAWSDDLVNWNRADDDAGIEITPGEWDGEMMCYPNLFAVDDRVYLAYNGNSFGREGFGLAVLESEGK